MQRWLVGSDVSDRWLLNAATQVDDSQLVTLPFMPPW